MGFWGKSDEDTEKEINNIRDKAAKVDELAEQNRLLKEQNDTFQAELLAQKTRLAAVEIGSHRETNNSERRGPTDWSDNADQAFAERVQPIVAQTQRQGEILAKQTARALLSGGEDSKYYGELMQKFGGEVDQLYATMSPEARLSHEAYLNCVHVVEGRRRKETFEIMERVKKAPATFEGEGGSHRNVPQEDRLTEDEEAYCKRMRFSPEQTAAFLKNVRTKMQFSEVR